MIHHPRTVASKRGFFHACVFLVGMHALAIAWTPPVHDETISCLFTLLENLLAVACLLLAAQRAGGVLRLLWWLFTASVSIWALTNVVWLVYYATTPGNPVSPLVAFGYRLYAVPLSFALFLRARDLNRSSQELTLDFLQIVLIVSLVFTGLFYVPTQNLPEAMRLQVATRIGDGINLCLSVAILLRWRFEPIRGMRRVYSRMLVFVSAYCLVSLLGNRVESIALPTTRRWEDLLWATPYLLAAALAITWEPQADDAFERRTPNLLRGLFLENLVFSALVLAVAVLSDFLSGRWHMWGNVAVAASLVAFALRLTMSQNHLQREVQERANTELALHDAHEQLESLLGQAQSRELELQKLGELVRLLQSCLTEDEACRVIAEGVQNLVSECSGRVYRVASPESAHSIAAWGAFPPSVSGFPLDQCWAVRGAQIHVNARVNSAARCAHLGMESGRPSMCVPFMAQNEIVGIAVLVFAQQRVAENEPTPSNIRRTQVLLDAITRHVAPALANLRLRQSLSDQAVRDVLTGLFNRRYMEETLDREVRRAVRRHRPLAVLMLDLDHFKSYNDRYGHAAGDTVLHLVGAFLRSRTRAEDIACRYGGEEFVVILPEATPELALQRAEEIRAGIKQLEIVHDARPLNCITVSIGLASAAADAYESSSLLRAVDAALYASKEKGRDCVTVASSPAPTHPQHFTAST